MHRPTRLRRDAGRTLSELLVALTILAMMARVAVPSITSLKAEYDLRVAANRLAFEITRTRMQAVGQNNYMRVRQLSSSSYAREKSTDGTTYTQEATTSLPSNVSIAVSDNGSPTFNRSGIATTATSYTLTRVAGTRTLTKTVTVTILGRVNVS